MTGLSPREVEICHMIKNGYSTKEIATVLAISPQTVSVHRKIIRRKLGLTGSDTNLISFLRTIESDS
jgi:DNA-binding CsgD family transcriptional regulator